MTSSTPHYPPPPPPGSQSPWPVNNTTTPPAVQQPSAYWPLTIISLLCSLLVGGIAMYFSSQVGTKWKAGDVAGARKASQIALIVGIIGIVIGLLVIVSAASADTSSYY